MTRRLLPPPTAADRAPVALAALLCALIVVASAGASAWLRATADDMAGQVFTDALYPSRQIQVFYTAVSDPEIPADAAALVDRALPPALRRLVHDPRHSVVTTQAVPQLLPSQPTDSPAYITVAGLPGTRDLVDIVEGDFPRSGGTPAVLPRAMARSYDGPRRVTVVEVALERVAAETMHVPVGSYIHLVSMRYRPDAPGEFTVLRVSGIYEAAAPYPSPLDDVDNARRPAISTLPEFNLVRTAALAADVETVLQAGWPADPEVRWTFDPVGTPSAAETEAVVDDARRLAVQPWPEVLDSAASASATGIGDLAATFVAERDASDTLSALVLAGLAAAAFAAVLAAASVLEMRRREVTDVLRARGAGTTQLVLVRGVEAVLVVVPGLLVTGLLLALRQVAVTDAVPSLAAAATCAALLTLAQASPWRELPERVRLAARDALQIVAVVLAGGLGVLMLLRDRLDAADPLLLLLPALVGVAAAALVVRGTRWGAAAWRQVAARARGLASLAGASQAGAAAQHVMLPVVGLVLAGTSALVAVSVDDSVRRGADRAAWQAVGADAVVTGGHFDADLQERVEALARVDAVAGVRLVEGSLDTRVGARRVTVVAVDPVAFEEVTRNTPVATRMPDRVDGRPGALVSAGLDLDEAETSLDFSRAALPITVTGRLETIPGVVDGGDFVLVDLEPLEGAVDERLARSQVLLVSGDPDATALRELVREVWPSAVVRTHTQSTADSLDDPVATRTLLVARAAAVGSVLLALFAAGLAVVFGRPLRRRTVAVLHALGAGPREVRRVSATELAPAVAAAGLAAMASAVLLTAVAARGVDVASLTGATGVSLGLDPTSWWVAAAVLAATVLLVAGASAWRVGSGSDRPLDEEETR